MLTPQTKVYHVRWHHRRKYTTSVNTTNRGTPHMLTPQAKVHHTYLAPQTEVHHTCRHYRHFHHLRSDHHGETYTTCVGTTDRRSILYRYYIDIYRPYTDPIRTLYRPITIMYRSYIDRMTIYIDFILIVYRSYIDLYRSCIDLISILYEFYIDPISILYRSI